MTANPSDEYGETYFLVVRCERQWYPDEFAKQRFAVVVELAHSEMCGFTSGSVSALMYASVREQSRVNVSSLPLFVPAGPAHTSCKASEA